MWQIAGPQGKREENMGLGREDWHPPVPQSECSEWSFERHRSPAMHSNSEHRTFKRGNVY